MKFNVVASFYEKDKEVDINNARLNSILGGNSHLNRLYNNGGLDTLLLTGSGTLYSSVSVGKKCLIPSKIVDLFKLVVKLINPEEQDLSLLEIGYTDDGTVLVSAYCDNSTLTEYMLFLNIVGEDLVLSEENRQGVNPKLVSAIEEKVKDVIMWANKMCPAPIYNIQYYFTKEGHTVDTIGKGQFYLGLCEATCENGVAGMDCTEDDKKGEYSLIFLED